MKARISKRRKIGLWSAGLGLCGLCVALWAMVTQPLLSGIKKDSNMNDVDPQRLKRHVIMLAETLSPRDYQHPQNLDRVAAYIRQEFEQAGGKVSEQPFQVRGVTYRNIRAFFGPQTQERVVIGAHYDAAGALPAADDNASGVAGLIELAHLVGKSSASKPLKTAVELVAFTLEEPPFFASASMGSAVHAKSLKDQKVPVRLMLCLEMIGYFSDAPGSQRFPVAAMKLMYPTVGNFIAVVGKLGQGGVVKRIKKAMQGASSLPVHSINAPPSLPGIDLSDHRNYWNAGYDAAMITDTSFFRNSAYHTARDTPNTLDYRRMAMVVEGVYAVALAEAGHD
jgi:hypothetical protein